MNDAELMGSYADNPADQAPFAELVERRLDLVYSAALRQLGGDCHRAEDVTQIVFADAARKASVLRHHPAPLAWLYTATRYAAVTMIRADRSRQQRELEALAMQESDTPSRADWERLRPVLDETMHDLDETERRVILLRFFDRSPLAAIGAHLGVSENAAQKKVDRTLDKLRVLLARKGITSTSAALAAALADQAVVAAPAGFASNVVGTATAANSAAASATDLLSLMTASKSTFAAAALLALAGIGLGYHEFSRFRSTERSLTAANGDLVARRERAEAATSRLVELKTRLTEATERAVKASETLAAARAGTPVAIIEPDAVQNSIGDQAKGESIAIYAPLFSRLNLKPEQISLVVQALGGGNDASESYNAGGVSGLWNLGIDDVTNPNLMALAREAAWEESGIHQAVAAAIGEEGYRALREFRENDPYGPAAKLVYNFNTGFGGFGAKTKNSLTPEQQDRLRETLVSSGSPNFQGTAHDAVSYSMPQITPEVLNRAEAFLTADQLEALRGYFTTRKGWIAGQALQARLVNARLANVGTEK